MKFPRMRRRLLRLPALFLSLCLTACLSAGQASSLAAPPPAPVSAPLVAGSVPVQACLGFLTRLSELGLDSPQLQALRTRLSCQALPFCREDRLDRCLAWAQAHPELTPEEAVVQVNMNLDRAFYTDTQVLDNPASVTALVNKYHALPEDYAPELVRLSPIYGTGSLTYDAAVAFMQMADAAWAEGISLYSVSAYRSYSTQYTLYHRYVSQYGQRTTDTFSARPGFSEHQTGLALDVNTASTGDHFELTPEYAWLQDNCSRFGFLLRYPEGKSAVTGYRFEPWHYRYVGREIAQACMERELTYEEYLARLPAASCLSLSGQSTS